MIIDVEVTAVAFFQLGDRGLSWSLLQAERCLRATAGLVQFCRLAHFDNQLGSHAREPLRETKEILRTQKKSACGASGPAEAERLTEPALRCERIVLLHLRATHRREPRGRRDALEERRFSGAVFADEECDRSLER